MSMSSRNQRIPAQEGGIMSFQSCKFNLMFSNPSMHLRKQLRTGKMIFFYQFTLIYFGFISILSLRAVCDSVVSIVKAQSYLNQRNCFKTCFKNVATTDLRFFWKCTDRCINECYCRIDSTSSNFIVFNKSRQSTMFLAFKKCQSCCVDLRIL